MNPETLLKELNSLDDREKERFFQLIHQQNLAGNREPETFVPVPTTKWHSREELIAIMESTKDEDDSL